MTHRLELSRRAAVAGETWFAITRPALISGLVAAVGLSSPATAQAPTTGSASIVSPGGVNLLRGQSGPEAAALGAVTFVLNTQLNGTLTVQLRGFVASSLGGTTVPVSGVQSGQPVTGTSMTFEALSLSFSNRAELPSSRSVSTSRPPVRVFLAQYN